MAVVGELLVLIGGNSSALTASLAKAEAELKGFSSTTAAQSGIAATALTGVGIAGVAVAAGTALFGAEAIRAGAQFQASMELIHTQAGATQAEVEHLTGAVLALAPAVGFSPDQLAMGLYHIESAGLRGAAAMNILEIAAKGAQIGHADLETVTNALVAAQYSGIKGTSDMAQAMAVLNTIVGTGNMRMEDLAASFSSGILPAAKIFGLSITDVGAALATMTDQGVPAEEAATRLRMTFSLLGAPTAQAASLLADIGLSSRALADDMRNNGLLSALQDLRDHMVGAGLDATEQAQLLAGAFGGGRSAGTIELLIQSLDKLQLKYTAITEGSSGFASAWEATQATASQQFAEIAASIDTVVVAIGSGLLPALQPVMDFIRPILSGIAQWAATNPQLAAQILLVAGGIGAMAASSLILGPALGILLGPIGIIAGLIAGIVSSGALTALVNLFGDWVNKNGPLINQLRDLAASGFSAFVDVVKALADVVGRVAVNIAQWVKANSPLITQILALTGSAIVEGLRVIAAGLRALGSNEVVTGLSIAAGGILLVNAALWLLSANPIIAILLGIVTAIGLLSLAWQNNWGGMRDAVIKAWPVINGVLDAIYGGMQIFGRAVEIVLLAVRVAWGQTVGAVARAAQGITFAMSLVPGPLQVEAAKATVILKHFADSNETEMDRIGRDMGELSRQPLKHLPTWTLGIDGFHQVIVRAVPGVSAAAARLRGALTTNLDAGWATEAGAQTVRNFIAGMTSYTASVRQASINVGEAAAYGMRLLSPAKGGPLSEPADLWGLKLVQMFQGGMQSGLGGLTATSISVGTAIIKGITDGIGHVAGAIGAWLFGGSMPALPAVPPIASGGFVPTVQLDPSQVIDRRTVTADALSGFHPQAFQHGGVVRGTGAQMAIVHGGETVIPAGQSGGAITLVNHTHVSLDGREIMDFVEQQLFRNAGTSSSGFQANNPVTSA